MAYPVIVEEEAADYAALVQEVHEAEGAQLPDRIRTALDSLLDEYPLCFGYWKRLADFEVAQGSVDRANQVFERALVLGNYCVELWAFYGAHAVAHWQRPDEVRALFERGARFVGSDYSADAFWDRYIDFETKRADDDYSRVSRLYRRTMLLPLRSLDALWLRFQQLAVERSCTELISLEEETLLQQELEAAGLAPPRPAGEVSS